ncbi:MAG: DUF4911 domain-containing protein [Deltaproteobacteria bacterium]|nr:DUF4911 domain-containing protein [Deltaproteobacteria bacterium]
MNPLIIFVHLPTENIAVLKFILESYESLAIVRTLSAERGELVLLGTEDSAKTLHELLQSLAQELSLSVIPQPDNVNEDWLLSEYYNSLAV